MRKYLFHLPFIWSVFWKRKRGEVEVYNFQNIADIFGLRPLFLLQVHEVADDVKFEFIVDYCTQPRFRVKIAAVNSGVYIRLRLGNFSCFTNKEVYCAFGTSVEKLQDFLTGYCLRVNSLYLS